MMIHTENRDVKVKFWIAIHLQLLAYRTKARLGIHLENMLLTNLDVGKVTQED